MNQYAKYKDTNYIILSDGNVARLLKPTKIHNQQYINFIIGGKQERVNLSDLREQFAPVFGQASDAEKSQT